MRSFFTLVLCLVLASSTYATTYYVSHHGNDRNSGRSSDQAWRSIKKVNAMMGSFKPGDQILFRRGDRFPGGIVVKVSGSAGQPIVFGAYGSGEDPIIDGFKHSLSWKSVGNQTWKASYTSPLDRVPNLFINQQLQPIGRYPNADEDNGGYLTISRSSGRNRLSVKSLIGSWTGADAVVRSARWALDRVPIAQQQGNNLSLAERTSYDAPSCYGMFIVNHRNTIDQEGEWAYHANERALYLRSSRDPNSVGVMVGHEPQLFHMNRVQHITIQDLDLWGAAWAAVRVRYSKHITVKNCRIFGSGQNGITIRYSQRTLLSRNRFEDTNSDAVIVEHGAFNEVADNTFLRTGMIAGMGCSGTNTYTAVLGMLTRHLNVHRNTIDQVGYRGVSFEGDYMNIQYNIVSNFCQVKDDGAGIYMVERRAYPHRLVQVMNNVISNGGNATVGFGTARADYTHSNGIYLDNYSNGVKIVNNTVYDCRNYGILIHNGHGNQLLKNTLYNNRRAIGMSQDYVVNNPIRDNRVEDNVLFAREASQKLLYLHSVDNNQLKFATFDRNHYYSPLNKEKIIRVDDRRYKKKLYSLAQWQEATSHDKSSKADNERWPAQQIKRYLSGNLLNNATFSGNTRGWQYYCNQNRGSARYTRNALDGGSMVIQFAGKNNGARMAVSPTSGLGSVQRGEKYVLRYTLGGDANNKELDTRIATRRGSYKLASNVHHASTSTQPKEVEAFLDIKQSVSDAILKIGVSENDRRIFLDNIELRKVETQAVDYDQYVQFVANNTARNLSVPLPAGEWRSVQGEIYRGSVKLDRARSMVLVRHDVAANSRTAVTDKKADSEAPVVVDDSDVQVYPNPLLDGDLNVTIDPVYGPSEVSVYNMVGQLVHQVEAHGGETVALSREELGGRGSCLVKVVSEDRSEVRKVVVN